MFFLSFLFFCIQGTNDRAPLLQYPTQTAGYSSQQDPWLRYFQPTHRLEVSCTENKEINISGGGGTRNYVNPIETTHTPVSFTVDVRYVGPENLGDRSLSRITIPYSKLYSLAAPALIAQVSSATGISPFSETLTVPISLCDNHIMDKNIVAGAFTDRELEKRNAESNCKICFIAWPSSFLCIGVGSAVGLTNTSIAAGTALLLTGGVSFLCSVWCLYSHCQEEREITRNNQSVFKESLKNVHISEVVKIADGLATDRIAHLPRTHTMQ